MRKRQSLNGFLNYMFDLLILVSWLLRPLKDQEPFFVKDTNFTNVSSAFLDDELLPLSNFPKIVRYFWPDNQFRHNKPSAHKVRRKMRALKALKGSI